MNDPPYRSLLLDDLWATRRAAAANFEYLVAHISAVIELTEKTEVQKPKQISSSLECFETIRGIKTGQRIGFGSTRIDPGLNRFCKQVGISNPDPTRTGYRVDPTREPGRGCLATASGAGSRAVALCRSPRVNWMPNARPRRDCLGSGYAIRGKRRARLANGEHPRSTRVDFGLPGQPKSDPVLDGKQDDPNLEFSWSGPSRVSGQILFHRNISKHLLFKRNLRSSSSRTKSLSLLGCYFYLF
ncbi:hypothetical protein IEQ34_012687 [Dendrobium chrysotoxum]|uniref:Uncharacterized protein n=1 Tax=Dendrobium chrysotoxum TaxID=161865 RepID=A0AAV7GMY0_DENCH|nr:hypothetical protein IEQ34_012687 [Dendrobium chrysotoxum]